MTDNNDAKSLIPGTDGLQPDSEQGEIPAQEVGKEEGNFVSRAEFEQSLADIKEETRRNAQSYSMQAESRINKRIQEEMKSLDLTIKRQKDIGLEIPADKVAAMKQNIISEAYSQDEQTQPEDSKPGSQAADTIGSVNDPEMQNTVERAKGMAQMAGFTIEPNDPELKEIKELPQSATPDQFLKVFQNALNTKAARLQRQGIAGSPNAIRGSTSSSTDALQKEYNEKKSKLPRGDPKAQMDLKIEYRKKGLKIG